MEFFHGVTWDNLQRTEAMAAVVSHMALLFYCTDGFAQLKLIIKAAHSHGQDEKGPDWRVICGQQNKIKQHKSHITRAGQRQGEQERQSDIAMETK